MTHTSVLESWSGLRPADVQVIIPTHQHWDGFESQTVQSLFFELSFGSRFWKYSAKRLSLPPTCPHTSIFQMATVMTTLFDVTAMSANISSFHSILLLRPHFFPASPASTALLSSFIWCLGIYICQILLFLPVPLFLLFDFFPYLLLSSLHMFNSSIPFIYHPPIAWKLVMGWRNRRHCLCSLHPGLLLSKAWSPFIIKEEIKVGGRKWLHADWSRRGIYLIKNIWSEGWERALS